jgi:hypothetical protein
MAQHGEGFVLTAIHNKAFESGDLLVEVGNYAFSGTGTTVEIPTNLSGTAIGVFLTPKTVTYSANDQLSSDGVVTTNAITAARNSSGTSGLSVYYMFIGYRYD